MRHDDWGARAEQWSGLRSRSATVCGVSVHYVVAEQDRSSARTPWVHLLVPPMTGSASMWLDLVPPMRRLGEVVSVDLPGTVAGDTGDPYPRGPRAHLDARFVVALVRELGLEGRVVLHGWSTGGLVAALAASMMPDAVRGLVLYAPSLPWRRTSAVEPFLWHTLGRLALAVGPAAARVVLLVAGRRILEAKRSSLVDGAAPGGAPPGAIGGDPGRVSRAQLDLWLDDLDTLGTRPERLAGSAAAYASAMTAMFVEQRRTNAALDAVGIPVLLLWGADDRLVDPASLRQHAERPGWTARPLDGVGHLLPVEVPDLCASEVGAWFAVLPGPAPGRRAVPEA